MKLFEKSFFSISEKGWGDKGRGGTRPKPPLKREVPAQRAEGLDSIHHLLPGSGIAAPGGALLSSSKRSAFQPPILILPQKENGPLERSKRENARGREAIMPHRKLKCAPWTPAKLGGRAQTQTSA